MSLFKGWFKVTEEFYITTIKSMGCLFKRLPEMEEIRGNLVPGF